MSILAQILDSLRGEPSAVETYNKSGDLVHRLSSDQVLEQIRLHRRLFRAWPAEDRRVALLFRSDETVDFLVAVFAALAERLTVVPLYPNWNDDQVEVYLKRYRLRSLVTGESLRARAGRWSRHLDRTLTVSLRSPPAGAAPAAGTSKAAAPDRAGGPEEDLFPRDLPPDHPCALIFTSGTSGDLAKLTLITHRNLEAAVQNIGRLDFLRPDMTLHCPLSASHIFAFVVILGFLHLKPRRVIFSDVQYLARIPQEKIGKIDAMILIPLVLNRLRAAFYERLERPEMFLPKGGEPLDPSLARLLRLPPPVRRLLKRLVGAAENAVVAREAGRAAGLLAWPAVLLVRRVLGRMVRRRLASPLFVVVGGAKPSLRSMAFLEAMGIRCLQGWGMTETTGPLAVCRLADHFRGAFGTCGDLFPGSRAWLDGEELVVEGPQIAAGYVEPEGALVAFRGSVHTGDRALIDGRGRLSILGKTSDRITLQNGLNYNPLLYEERLHTVDLRMEHKLEEAVVIGDGQPRLGCVFFLREPYEPGEEVRRYLTSLLRAVNAELAVDEHLGPWAVSPKRLREADVLSPSAKLIRRRVEERYAHLFAERRLELV